MTPVDPNEACVLPTIRVGDLQTVNPASLPSDPLRSYNVLSATDRLAQELKQPLRSTPAPWVESHPNVTRSGKTFNEEQAAGRVWRYGHGRVFADNQKIYEEWKDLSSGQIGRIANSYQDHYGRSMWKDLEAKVPPEQFAKLRAQGSGAFVKSSVAHASQALQGKTKERWVNSGEVVLKEMRGLTAEELRDVSVSKELSAVGMGGTRGAFKTDERQREAQALILEANPEKAARIRLQGSLKHGDGEDVVAQLRALDRKGRNQLLEKAGGAEALTATATQKLDGDAEVEVKALMSNKMVLADAAALHKLASRNEDRQAFLDRFGDLTNPKDVRTGPGDHGVQPEDPADAKRRKEFLATYREQYDESPYDTYKKHHSGEPTRLKRIATLQNGKGERREDILLDSIRGPEPSVSDLKRAFTGLEAKDAKALTESYRGGHYTGPEALKYDIDNRLSGRKEFQAFQALQGDAKGDKARQREQQALNFERSGLSSGFTSADENAQAQLDKAKAAFDEADRLKTSDPTRAAALRAEGDKLTRYANIDNRIFEGRKDEITDGATKIVTNTAVTVAAVLSEGAVLPFLTGIIASEGTRKVMEDNSYDVNDGAARVGEQMVNTVVTGKLEQLITPGQPGVVSRTLAGAASNGGYEAARSALNGDSLEQIALNAGGAAFQSVQGNATIGFLRGLKNDLQAGKPKTAVPAVEMDEPVPTKRGFSPEEAAALRQQAKESAQREVANHVADGATDHMEKMVDYDPKLKQAVADGSLTVTEAYTRDHEAQTIMAGVTAKSKELISQAVQEGRITEADASILTGRDPLDGRLTGPFREELNQTTQKFAGTTGLALEADGSVERKVRARIIDRVVEVNPARTSDGTAVYGAQRPQDVAVIESAKTMMARSTEGLAGELKAVHLSSVMERNVDGVDATRGFMVNDTTLSSHSDTIDLRRPRVTVSDAETGTRSAAALDFAEVEGTTIHEVVHVKDGNKNWVSEAPDSPMGKGDHKVSDRAKANAREEMAETGAFLITIDNGSPLARYDQARLNPEMQTKLEFAADKINLKPGVLDRVTRSLQLENQVAAEVLGSGEKSELARAFSSDEALQTGLRAKKSGEASAAELRERGQTFEEASRWSQEKIDAAGLKNTPQQLGNIAESYSQELDAALRADVRAATTFVRRFQEGIPDGPHAFPKVDDSVQERVQAAAQAMGASPEDSRRMWLHLRYSGQAETLGPEFGLKTPDQYREFGDYFRSAPEDQAGWKRFDALAGQVFPKMSAQERRALVKG